MRQIAAAKLKEPCLALLALACASSSASAQPAREARGQLSLRYTIFTRGVSHVSSSDYELDVRLVRSRAGQVELHVRGTIERASAFLEPPGTMREQDRGRAEIDATHRGEIVSEDASGLLVRFEPGAHGTALEWRCDRGRENVGGQDLELLRCAIATPLTGMPWNDPAPAYLRATMVLAIGGSVRADVSASPDRGSHATLLPAR